MRPWPLIIVELASLNRDRLWTGHRLEMDWTGISSRSYGVQRFRRFLGRGSLLVSIVDVVLLAANRATMLLWFMLGIFYEHGQPKTALCAEARKIAQNSAAALRLFFAHLDLWNR